MLTVVLMITSMCIINHVIYSDNIFFIDAANAMWSLLDECYDTELVMIFYLILLIMYALCTI